MEKICRRASTAGGRAAGRENVGITANPLDDLIHNFDGTAYWFSGTQGGASTGSVGDEAMKLNDDGDLYIKGALARTRAGTKSASPRTRSTT